MKQAYGFAGVMIKRVRNGIIAAAARKDFHDKRMHLTGENTHGCIILSGFTVAAAPAPPHSRLKNWPENRRMIGYVTVLSNHLLTFMQASRPNVFILTDDNPYPVAAQAPPLQRCQTV